jgi:hypothetical protein
MISVEQMTGADDPIIISGIRMGIATKKAPAIFISRDQLYGARVLKDMNANI